MPIARNNPLQNRKSARIAGHALSGTPVNVNLPPLSPYKCNGSINGNWDVYLVTIGKGKFVRHHGKTRQNWTECHSEKHEYCQL